MAVLKLAPKPAPAPAAPKRIRAKITYQRERFADIWHELGPLIARHDREIWSAERRSGFGGEWGKLTPDIQRYLNMEAVNPPLLHINTARTGNGRLIGYAADLVTVGLHYRSMEALSDTVWLHPDYRVGKGLSIKKHPGFRLLLARERMLDQMKVERRRIAPKVWIDFGPVLKLLGYEPEATVYLKVVPQGRKEED